jgi:DNA-binding CsgD family transcriptional regulator
MSDRSNAGKLPFKRMSRSSPTHLGPFDVPDGVRATDLASGDERYVVISHPLPEGHASKGLTDAESAVLVLVLRGLSTEVIAKMRGTSSRTIANQLGSIYRKHGVRSRVELAAALSAPQDAEPDADV